MNCKCGYRSIEFERIRRLEFLLDQALLFALEKDGVLGLPLFYNPSLSIEFKTPNPSPYPITNDSFGVPTLLQSQSFDYGIKKRLNEIWKDAPLRVIRVSLELLYEYLMNTSFDSPCSLENLRKGQKWQKVRFRDKKVRPVTIFVTDKTVSKLSEDWLLKAIHVVLGINTKSCKHITQRLLEQVVFEHSIMLPPKEKKLCQNHEIKIRLIFKLEFPFYAPSLEKCVHLSLGKVGDEILKKRSLTARNSNDRKDELSDIARRYGMTFYHVSELCEEVKNYIRWEKILDEKVRRTSPIQSSVETKGMRPT